MGFQTDLEQEVSDIFISQWTRRNGRDVPDPGTLRLGNDGCDIVGTVLYADLAQSTLLVDSFEPPLAAEVYKTFLTCCARIIRNEGGTIAAYDGDRVMAVFAGDNQNTQAARTGLKINWAVKNIVRNTFHYVYPTLSFSINHSVGIDKSKLMVAKIGVKNDNDLVWVGTAANHAAKLCTLREESFATWITKEVYDGLPRDLRIHQGYDIWEDRTWKALPRRQLYRSKYWYALKDGSP